MAEVMQFLVIVLLALNEAASVNEACCPKGRGKFRNTDNYPRNEVIYTDNGIIICDRLCKEITNCYLRKTFGNLFTDSADLMYPYIPQSCLPMHSNREPEMVKRDTCYIPPRDDGDQCCATVKYVTKYFGKYNNIANESVDILYLNSSDGTMYQYGTGGLCMPESVCGYNEQPCVQEFSVQSFLAYKPGTPPPYFSFQLLFVPSYCSCKNIEE